MILSEEAGADASVVDGNESVVIVGLLCVFTMVHVTEIVLLALEEYDSESIQS